MREIELKFIVDQETRQAIWPRARALNLVEGDLHTKTILSVYFDTPDHALKTAGYSIRLRQDEAGWTQTIKAGRTLKGGLSRVEEVDVAVPEARLELDAVPDEKLRIAISRCAGKRALQPICETEMTRTSAELVLPDGTRVELALDAGDIRANGQSVALIEAELELITGEPRGLYDLARALLATRRVQFSQMSKAARGYLLAEKGMIAYPVAPARSRAIPLKRTWGADQAAQTVLRGCFGRIVNSIAVTLERDDREGPHQLRVSLRELRSALSVFRRVVASDTASALGAEARWLGREIGQLRDLDVVANDIVGREAAAHPEEKELSKLVDALAPYAMRKRTQVRTLLCAPRVQVFLLDLSQFIETGAWQAGTESGTSARRKTPVAELARNALAKRWKQTCKRAQTIEKLDENQRHELRKQLKKLRYATEFLAPLFPEKKVKPFLRRLKKLQNAFGDLNDVVLARTVLGRIEQEQDWSPAMQRAIGWVNGASRTRADAGWASAILLWHELRETRTFWR